MKKPLKIVLFLTMLTSIGLVVWYFVREDRQVTDSDFVMIDNILSPDGQHRILSYRYDQGAFGFSRDWWAITPREYQHLNLANFELPDCYAAESWHDQSELVVLKEDSCQNEGKLDDLKTGDLFMGVRIQVIPESEFLRGTGIQKGTTILPPH